MAKDQRRPCPHCGEAIMRSATVCRFCGRDVPQLAEQRSGLPMPLVAVVVLVLIGVGVALGNDSRRESAGNDCVSVPRSTLDAIEDGFVIEGGSLSRGQAWEGSDWWYVAAEIDAPGLEGSGDVGVWAVPSPSNPGPIYVANAVAREFTEWGVAGSADALEANLGVSRSDARVAAGCV